MSTELVAGGSTEGTASVETSAGLQWPFVERRRSDRREQDRRLCAERARTHLPVPPDATSPCTAREQQILLLLMQGMTNKEIGHHLGIAEETVKKHLQHVYRKFGVRRRASLILRNSDAAQLDRRSPSVE